jgi:hypothetical protein
MILEGVVTTVAPDGAVNVAPMGPHVPPEAAPERLERFELRPFRTARTYANLKAHGEGVLHVTDDVLLLARAALGPVEPPPALVPASRVRGWVLRDACRYHEFRVVSCDDRAERAAFEVEVVHAGRWREFFGFNRAKHAVLEAAILATRTGLLPLDEIEAELARLAVPVEKTGGPREREAFALLRGHVEKARQEAGVRSQGSGVREEGRF